MARHELVRPSRDGDQFHYHWAARQCLALLPGKDDLIAVSIEGASKDEGNGAVQKGDELIDVGLYYGAEDIDAGRLVRYVQLKHSTRQVSDPWTASGLQTTIRGFAKRYAELRGRFSALELEGKVRFEFTTNRPIATTLREALEDLSSSTSSRHRQLRQTLVVHSGLDEVLAVEFFRLLSVEGSELGLWKQRNLLTYDVSTYLAEADYDAPVQLKELVTRKATSEFANDPSIRKIDVLHALRVSESDLQPSPSLIETPKNVLPRDQEAELLTALLTAEHPLVIHADGGVGKSILALRLSASMPLGSEAVLYDCFGNGLYRNTLHFRHRHRDALVQIANELSARGLCHPLIPSSRADAKQYLRAFSGRLHQAIGLLRARDPRANLCIIIDAADNAEMAAEERREPSFVRDLIRLILPDGVRIAFTCRTHRQDRLAAPPDARRIELSPFSLGETRLHLHGTHPDATKSDVAEFAFLSSSNPRVQALALETNVPIQDMLKALGPTPSTVDRAIGELLQRAVDKLKDRAGPIESSQIDLICQGLAVLRPLVPIAVLAQISGTPEGAVRSFALDLGRPLLVKGSSLHFVDEPSETWFRERYKPDAAAHAQFLDRLRPLTRNSAYVASTLPQLLLAADRIEELVELALSTQDLPVGNPLERRDVELQRLLFALKACLLQGRHLDAAKLALKAGGEVAGETRQIKLIQENTHIAAVLLAPDRIDEMVSRRIFSSTWMGSHHAYDAGLLSGRSEFFADATSKLRMAIEWLRLWAGQSEDEQHVMVDDEDRTELAMAYLRLRGAEAAADFLRLWTRRDFAFTAGKHLGRRLVDLGHYDQIDALARAAGNDVWLVLGLAEAAAGAGRSVPPGPLSRLVRLLADRRVLLDDATSWNEQRDILYAIRAAMAQAVRHRPQDAAMCAAILRRYLPAKPPSYLAQRFGFDRAPLLRAYALEAALRGHSLTLLDVAPDDVRKQIEEKAKHGGRQEADTFEREVGGLLPWFVLAAEIAVGQTPVDLNTRIAFALKATASAESRDYQRHYHLRQTAALEWLQILRDAATLDATSLSALRTWMGSKSEPLWTQTLTSLCRVAARTEGLANLSLEFASEAFASMEGSREDAESRATDYLSLARAILPTSPQEAAAYFNQSIEIVSRIGDENLDRWSALLHLAKAAAHRDTPRAESAYRLSRAAELTYQYVARDKHFDWDETTEALVDLCGASALTILSRWRDRRFGRASRLLPVAVYRLVEQGRLPALTPVALAGLVVEWNRLEDLERALTAEPASDRQRQIAEIAYRYLRVDTHDAKTWARLSQIGVRLGVELLDLQRLLALSESASARAEKKSETRREAEALERRHPDWDDFFRGIDLVDAGALREAYALLRTYDPPYRLEEFFREGVKRVGVGHAPDFVNAVAAWPDFGTFELQYLLNALVEVPSTMLSLRHAVREAVLLVCRREPQRVRRRGWWAFLPFERLEADGIVSDRDVVVATIEGYSALADSASASALFHMVDPLSSCLTPGEADEALNFGLDLIEDVLRPEDGDGPWQSELQPPICCIEALAGYLWVGLGSPKVAERWAFAHVVRTLVELEWSEVLDALRKLAQKTTAQPFVDAGLYFYALHARQWLLLGLARGAGERPYVMQPLVPFLRECMAEQHVLIRAFARDALRIFLATDGMEEGEVAELEAINSSQLPLSIYSGWHDSAADEDPLGESRLSEDEKYSFGIDIGPYWFASLGRVFGVRESEIKTRARAFLRERLGVHSGKLVEDIRYQRKLFDDGETHHSHGSVPLSDDLRAYHAYHAMMFVAAQLLETRPVRKRSDDAMDEFQDWLERYLLTRADGRWLADRRDPRLIAEPDTVEGYRHRDWCWHVSADDLDRRLLTDDGFNVLWGYWQNGHGNDSEVVIVKSALTARESAESLRAALQTAPEPGRFDLPDADDAEGAVDAGVFSLRGWVTRERETTQLDEEDPWAAKISYPGPAPSTSTIESMTLLPSADERRWFSEPEILLRSETWGEIRGYGRDKEAITGTRLSGNVAFVRRLLEENPDDCLVLSVLIRRTPPRDTDDAFSYPWPYVRYYLMDVDGIARPF